MTPLALLILGFLPKQVVDAPTLEYYQDQFVARKGKETWRVSPRPPEDDPVMVLAFRRNDHYAVWDERGLTIRHGAKSRSTQFEDTPTSPRLFSKEEILRTASYLREGRRKRPATGISGSLRLGTYVYFLVRWEENLDSTSRTWLEVLYRVKLDGKSLNPELVGRFEGLSVAFRVIDSRLLRIDGNPSVVTRVAARSASTQIDANGVEQATEATPESWGVSTYDPALKKFAYRPLGGKLSLLMPTSRDDALFVEASSYGNTVGGHVSLADGVRRDNLEGKGRIRYIDTQRPFVAIFAKGAASTVRNADTGAESAIPVGAGVQRMGPYVVVYAPYDRPKAATLYDPRRWTALAQWKAEP